MWRTIRAEVEQSSEREPALASFYYASILNHASMAEALAFNLALRLDSPTLSASLLKDVCKQALTSDGAIREATEADCAAYYERDPACDRYSMPLLYFKGYQAIQAHRVANWLWCNGRRSLALYIQNRIACVFAVDIHPAARLGKGIMLDHATGVVLGETTRVGDNVSLLHGVVLGGSGCGSGQRHPIIGDGVLIGAGAKLLGRISVGEGSKIASNSVVLCDVPPGTTYAGVPARMVGRPAVAQPALAMNQYWQ